MFLSETKAPPASWLTADRPAGPAVCRVAVLPDVSRYRQDSAQFWLFFHQNCNFRTSISGNTFSVPKLLSRAFDTLCWSVSRWRCQVSHTKNIILNIIYSFYQYENIRNTLLATLNSFVLEINVFLFFYGVSCPKIKNFTKKLALTLIILVSFVMKHVDRWDNNLFCMEMSLFSNWSCEFWRKMR